MTRKKRKLLAQVAREYKQEINPIKPNNNNKSSREQLTCKKNGGCTITLSVTSFNMKNLLL
jgi:hypothetical protein